jgi:hypothetical protein
MTVEWGGFALTDTRLPGTSCLVRALLSSFVAVGAALYR